MKKRRLPDPVTAPVSGKRGPCSICGQTGDLTDNHVPPRAVGNSGLWHVRSFSASASVGGDIYFPRSFRDGLCFRTICARCNSTLGAREDKALIEFYRAIRQWTDSSILLGPNVVISTKPNLLYRALLAHLTSANDGRPPTSFDTLARSLLNKSKLQRADVPNLFYWHYNGPDLLLLRDMAVMEMGLADTFHIMQVLKFAPVGFLLTDRQYTLPNLRTYIQPDDELDASVYFKLRPADQHPFWPAYTDQSKLLLAGGSMQVHATRSNPQSPRHLSRRPIAARKSER